MSRLQFSTGYSWYIVVRDIDGAEHACGRSHHAARELSTLHAGVDGSGQRVEFLLPPTVTLQWQGGDPDGDAVTSIVYFGTTNPPPSQSSTSGSSRSVTVTSATNYYWQVRAVDSHGATSALSEIRSLRTDASRRRRRIRRRPIRCRISH